MIKDLPENFNSTIHVPLLLPLSREKADFKEFDLNRIILSSRKIVLILFCLSSLSFFTGGFSFIIFNDYFDKAFIYQKLFSFAGMENFTFSNFISFFARDFIPAFFTFIFGLTLFSPVVSCMYVCFSGARAGYLLCALFEILPSAKFIITLICIAFYLCAACLYSKSVFEFIACSSYGFSGVFNKKNFLPYFFGFIIYILSIISIDCICLLMI